MTDAIFPSLNPSQRDNLLDIVKGMTQSALAAIGPWLLTIIALGSITAVASLYLHYHAIFEFRLIVIYNFAFSLVFSAPVFMLATRQLADGIRRGDVSTAPGMLVGALAFIYAIQLPVVAAFYVFYVAMPTGLMLSAIINYMLITTIWLVTVFLTTLKEYALVAYSFTVGIIIAIAMSVILFAPFKTTGIINGFNIGLACIIASLMAGICASYPYTFRHPFLFLGYCKKYWEIALGGFIYNVAVWVDKWIMWFAPESEKLPNHMVSYPHYDITMFLAYLTIIPSMALFIASIETHFFEQYLRFYRDIQHKAPLATIQGNHKNILTAILANIRNFIVLQGSISALAVFMAPTILAALSINPSQITIFRYGVVGVFFHVMILFMTILLFYFDSRKRALWIYTLFLMTNAAFTYMGMHAGFGYYGYGYFLSSLVTFIFASVVTLRYVIKLPYHTFVTTNSSVIKRINTA